MQGRIDDGSDYIKLVLEDGASFGFDIPTLDETTLRAAMEEAISRDLLVVTHVSTLEDAKIAIENGSHGLAHVWVDVPADRDFIDLIVDRAGFVVPTLVVRSTATTTPSGQSVIDDPALGPRLRPAEKF